MCVVPCDCVVQAVQLFSLRASPQPARWPKTIQPHEMLDAASSARPGAERGRAVDAGGPLRWSPCQSSRGSRAGRPHAALLPHGIVSEAMYVTPPDWRRMHLNASAVDAHVGAARPLAEMLPGVAVRLSAAAACRRAATAAAGAARLRRAPQRAAARRRRCHCAAAATPTRGTSRAAAGGRRTLAAAVSGLRAGPPAALARCDGGGVRGAEPDEEAAIRAADDWAGADDWRWLAPRAVGAEALPERVLGAGRCLYGFCHCEAPFWGLDCGLSAARARLARRAAVRPHLRVRLPAALRRSCASWRLPEDLGDHVLASDHLEPDAARADLFWVYAAPMSRQCSPRSRG